MTLTPGVRVAAPKVNGEEYLYDDGDHY